MRISSAEIFRQSVATMNLQQSQLSKTQQQLATGLKRSTAADGPAEAARQLSVERSLAEVDQLGSNASLVGQRLALTENALADSSNILQRLRDIAINANNGTLSDSDRQALAVEVAAQRDALLQIANRQDGEGNWLFSGTEMGSGKPFVDGATVSYRGDQNQRQLEVAPGEFISDTRDGSAVFQRIPRSAGGTQAVFATAQALYDSLMISGTDAASETQRQAGFSTAIGDLDHALKHLDHARAEVGIGRARAEVAETTHLAMNEQLQTQLSDLRDVDYAETSARFAQQLTSLQAAQKAFVQVQGLSLFNYL